jgi:hypothetical protein
MCRGSWTCTEPEYGLAAWFWTIMIVVLKECCKLGTIKCQINVVNIIWKKFVSKFYSAKFHCLNLKKCSLVFIDSRYEIVCTYIHLHLFMANISLPVMKFNPNFTYIHVHYWEWLPSALWWKNLPLSGKCDVMDLQLEHILSSCLSAHNTTSLSLLQDND